MRRQTKRQSRLFSARPAQRSEKGSRTDFGQHTGSNSNRASKNREVPTNERSRRGGNSVPFPQRERIKSKFIGGKNISEISREEGRHWTTVARIVKEEDVQEYVKNLRARFYGAMEDVLKETLVAIKVKNDGWLGLELLDRAGVIPPKETKPKVELTTNQQHTPEEIHDYLRRKIAIGLMEGAIEKHKYYGMPFPEADKVEKAILAQERIESARAKWLIRWQSICRGPWRGPEF